jgi:hypothetical protein
LGAEVAEAEAALDLAGRIEASRAEDTCYTWGYSARVSSRHHYLTVATPKVACTTLKRVLQHWEGEPEPGDWGKVHEAGIEMRLARFDTETVMRILTDGVWLRFCFVRNPYDRMFSAWKSKIGNTWDTQYQPLRDRIRIACDYPETRNGLQPIVSFADFVRFVTESDDPSVIHDGHWERQVNVLLYDLVPYDLIGRFESFREDFVDVLRRLDAPNDVIDLASEVINPTAPVPLAAAYDAELANRVHDYYRADFETFDYDADSWRFYTSWR